MTTINQIKTSSPFLKWLAHYFLTSIFFSLLSAALYAQTCDITAPNPLPACGSTGNQLCASTTGTIISYEWSVTGTGWAITDGQGTSCITYTAGTSGTTGNFSLTVTNSDYYQSTCYVSFSCQAGGTAEGCTPGFWKNARTLWNQPTDNVSACIAGALPDPYNGDGTTSDLFRTTFGLTSAQMTAAGLNPDLTLLQALNTGGGGCFKLLRHSVAALLNGCGLTSYTYTTAQVLTMTHDAIANKTCEPTASDLAAANNIENCPLSSDGNGDLITSSQPSSIQTPSGKSENKIIQVYPNPYSDQINFSIKSSVSGKATLQIYDLTGRKLAVVFDGTVNAGASYTSTYKVPASNKVPIMYNLTIGNQTYRGMVLPRK